MKRFGSVVALADVDLDVRGGEVLALAGENGSGKSTLARVLAGAIQPERGRIFLGGEPVVLETPRAALERGIALVAQDPTAVPALTVAENVLLTRLAEPLGFIRRRRLAAEARPYLELVGLDELDPLAPFESLRPGERELVEVAKALAARPQALILDEATTRLSEPEFLFRLIEQLVRGQGLAVVFITQRLREILRVADRAVVLRDGRVAGELDRGELSERALTRLMIGRDLPASVQRRPVSPGEPALRVEGLVSDRSPHPISLEVRAGEIVGVAGLVGSGRSELLETIAGARRARAGRVIAGGRAVRPGSVRAALRAGLALVPEDRHRQGLVLGASLRANVALSRLRALSRSNRREEYASARELAQRLRIRCRDVDAEVGSLSGGNQQKVMLARALAARPRVLLLDEPTRGVDVGAREEIYALIDELVREGTAVLLSSSDVVELVRLCDRVVVLSEGRVVGALERPEITEEAIVALAVGMGERRVA